MIDENTIEQNRKVTKKNKSFSTGKFQLCNNRTRNLKKFTCKIKTLSIQVSIRKKWFLKLPYNPHQNLISNHLECLNHFIDTQSNTFILTGVFNVSVKYISMINVCDLNGIKNFINIPTYYKDFYNPVSISFILTNRRNQFHHSTLFETSLSYSIYLLQQNLK